ncbi:hypothetical protein PATSB16_02840 [Pandoraea thiooxydans]|uniref:Uncharacterized protein n=1 Tax=Pandoraea thiooxydans TaxID=445709 RepID=A0A0G3ESX5_9BURK|nr:hypothetical protein [Pandoraea thiooxydans]AKJ70178.1 hypothetical protein ABW99_20150 [Pandoraea thiooxydans]APR93628.1 hypothetical protein PATSB16_02840 [Pandoraea thiooxydans]
MAAFPWFQIFIAGLFIGEDKTAGPAGSHDHSPVDRLDDGDEFDNPRAASDNHVKWQILSYYVD